jgi:hypothetical protein
VKCFEILASDFWKLIKSPSDTSEKRSFDNVRMAKIHFFCLFHKPQVLQLPSHFLHYFFSVRSKQVLWFWIVQDVRYYIVLMCVLDLFAVSHHVILSRGDVIVFIINSMFLIRRSSLITSVDFSKSGRQ